MGSLQEQVADPQHVYILLTTGRFYSHHFTEWVEGKVHAFMRRGEPIRFTRLAATRMLEKSAACQGGKLMAVD